MLATDILHEEQREYFRIGDEVALRHRAVSDDAALEFIRQARAGHPDLLGAAAAAHAGSIELKRRLDACRPANPGIVACLDEINAKVDTLMRVLAARDSALPDHPTHKVDISAGGMRFEADEPFEPGDLLKLDIQFFPSRFALTVFGRVVRGDEPQGADRGPLVSVRFSYVNETDCDLLIRHVLNCEARMLRGARATARDALDPGRSAAASSPGDPQS